MQGPLLYKPQPRWQVAAALGGALAVHAIAVGIAALKPPEPIMDLSNIPEAVVEMSIEQVPEVQPPPPEEIEEPEPDAPPEPVDTPEFVEEKPTPPPKPKTDRPPRPIAPIRRPVTGTPGPPSAAKGPAPTGKAAMIYKPNISYPYEARRAKATGSGVVVVSVSPSGSVTSASMGQSTGNSILDNASVTAMRSARFKPGTAPTVRIPITWTLTGARL
ncbi:hypothetical protein BH18VER1_BH18VER1_17750 [soil metagenome]